MFQMALDMWSVHLVSLQMRKLGGVVSSIRRLGSGSGLVHHHILLLSHFPQSINHFLGNGLDILSLKDHTYSAGLTDPDLALSKPPRAAHSDSQMKPERKPHKSLSSEKRSQPASRSTG